MTKEAVPEIRRFSTALVQMEPAHLNRKRNIDKMTGFIREAAAAGARLIVFPELVITGYVPPYVPSERIAFYEASEPVPGPTSTLIQHLAQEYGVYVVFGMIERGQSDLGPVMYNVAVMVGPGGVIACHRKVHLPGGEKLYFVPGSEIRVFATDLGRIALLVCYDFWFPESARIAGLKGAQVIVDCANWPSFDVDPWFAMGPGTAASNALWFVQVNRVGGEEYWPGFGGSQISGPGGRVVTRATDQEGIFYGEMDVAETTQRRMTTPIWFDRRPEVYEEIVKRIV